MAWIEPITNRTNENKGFCNYEMLNRIENNCAFLEEQFNANLFSVSIETKTNWTMSDFPFLSQINRIRDNVNVLRNVYYVMVGSPVIIYHNTLDWIDANSLEQNLKNLNSMLENMKINFKYSGAYIAGQGRI